jgi:hypothetical protein
MFYRLAWGQLRELPEFLLRTTVRCKPFFAHIDRQPAGS